MADEPFANPVAPAHHVHSESSQSQTVKQPLTNEDFRKLIATPRIGGSSAASSSSLSRSRLSSSRSKRSHHSRSQKPVLSQDSGSRQTGAEDGSPDDASHRKKDLIKSMKQKENDVLSELAQRYRDRAKERRDGANPDYIINDDVTGMGANVAPDHKSRTDFAERRKQLIEESKFLGGDMEHTHLVKGLDYALLHKVKAELQQGQLTEQEEDEDEDNGEERGVEDGQTEIDRKCMQADIADGSDEFDIKSRLALSIVSLLNQKVVQRNELFLPSRMAYLVDLENGAPDDIPITVIRSKSECPSLDSALSHSTNDIVINKLAVIIASHRTGVIRKEGEAASSSLSKSEIQRKKVKYEHDVNSESSRKIGGKGDSQTCKSDAGLSIYDDLDDDYEPVRTKRKSTA